MTPKDIEAVTVTQVECAERRIACDKLNEQKRGRIEDQIKAMRREQKLGFTLLTIFIMILGILIRTGVV